MLTESKYTGSFKDSYSTYLKAQEAKQRAEEKAAVRIKYLRRCNQRNLH